MTTANRETVGDSSWPCGAARARKYDKHATCRPPGNLELGREASTAGTGREFCGDLGREPASCPRCAPSSTSREVHDAGLGRFSRDRSNTIHTATSCEANEGMLTPFQAEHRAAMWTWPGPTLLTRVFAGSGEVEGDRELTPSQQRKLSLQLAHERTTLADCRHWVELLKLYVRDLMESEADCTRCP